MKKLMLASALIASMASAVVWADTPQQPVATNDQTSMAFKQGEMHEKMREHMMKAMAACEGKSEAAACTIQRPDGQEVQGTCQLHQRKKQQSDYSSVSNQDNGKLFCMRERRDSQNQQKPDDQSTE